MVRKLVGRISYITFQKASRIECTYCETVVARIPGCKSERSAIIIIQIGDMQSIVWLTLTSPKQSLELSDGYIGSFLDTHR